MMKRFNLSILALALGGALALAGCSDGKDGADGAPGAPGEPGAPGTPGAPAGAFVDTVASAADFALTLAPGDIVVNGEEPFHVAFSAQGRNAKGEMVPFVGLDKVAFYVLNQTENPEAVGAPVVWTNHAMANDASYYLTCTPEGVYTSRGEEKEACTLVEDEANPGHYTGTWEHEGTAPIILDSDPNALHRVMVRTFNLVDAEGNGVADKVLTAAMDYIPATGELAVSLKDSVSSEACIRCHGQLDGYPEGDGRFANVHAHHNYQKVENCVMCHNPAIAGGEDDPEKGWNADFAPMVHRLHAGHRIADSLTGEAAELFAHIGFPAELNECAVCHDGEPTWQFNVYADACEACHVDVNFATGEGHSDMSIPQADDSACGACHTGNLSPMAVHQPGRRDAMMANGAFKVAVQSVEKVDNGVDDDMSLLRVTAEITLNGAAPADDIDFAEYMTSTSRGLLIGNLDAKGTVTRGLGMSILTDAVSLTNGVLITEKAFDDARLVGSLYATAEVQVCGNGIEAVKCDAEDALDAGFANEAPVFYVNLDGGDAVMARLDQPERTTVDEASCNVCHDNLTHIKGTHGAYDFTQCMDCHNETWGGSYHPVVEYMTDEVDADGNPVFKEIEGLSFSTRDLVIVAHRFHSGLWDDNRGVPAIYLDANGSLHGYPAPQSDCQACHLEGAPLFAPDGGLHSGKRAMNVGTDAYISPVSEACRSCHQHADAAALAHFEANGAYVEGKPASTADLPVESCATCHAEGKTYGIDKVHGGGH
ncbi:OmcA/MtrC family decaheme c-type cytochrome [Ferrimonas balearica]|uniref:OmcA/MtrC family decaheme c-type cytochrome n=1 Tax=Ferrimonas balearica TaxID=44012 RepID=UPI001C99B9E4|nr:OmcA/MtrC family decaheme c-type cytochrome [Ferrimonas balearica]MBY5990638.1 OmcA/MtrC family decaheme c-type cytochrome [Ferrimonas balearica]